MTINPRLCRFTEQKRDRIRVRGRHIVVWYEGNDVLHTFTDSVTCSIFHFMQIRARPWSRWRRSSIWLFRYGYFYVTRTTVLNVFGGKRKVGFTAEMCLTVSQCHVTSFLRSTTRSTGLKQLMGWWGSYLLSCRDFDKNIDTVKTGNWKVLQVLVGVCYLSVSSLYSNWSVASNI